MVYYIYYACSSLASTCYIIQCNIKWGGGGGERERERERGREGGREREREREAQAPPEQLGEKSALVRWQVGKGSIR